MRPDDRLPVILDTTEPVPDLPLDADVEALDGELGEAGGQARRTHHGRSQPTRVYAVNLRARLLGVITPFGNPPGQSTEVS